MKTSEQIEKLSAALVKAQAAIKPAIKDSTNPHFRSKYADLTAVWEAIHQAMTDNDLALIQLPAHSEDNRVHLTTRVLHSSGQWIEETASIPVVKQDPHGYGSGLTYLRRYSGVAAFFVPTEDDDGNAAAKGNGIADGIRPYTATDVAKDALAGMEPDEQNFLREQAMTILARHDKGLDLVGYISEQKYTTEEKLALWSLLPSNVRSAIKKATPAHPAAQS